MKVLIWNTYPLLERAGGPSTYLYHLQTFFSGNSEIDVRFLNMYEMPVNSGSSAVQKKSLLPGFFRNLVRINQNLKNEYKSLSRFKTSKLKFDLNEFDVIHFHSTVELFAAKEVLASFKGKVVLTSHTPLAPHLEHFGEVLPHRFILPSIKKKYISLDEYAFKRADVIMFPVKEAMEPYFNTWPDFAKIIAGKEVKFVPTGIPKAIVTITRKEIRNQLGIKEDATIILFAGRHNKIKGYDLLKKFGEVILKRDNNVHIVVLGKEQPLMRLDHPRWIEVGWTKDPVSYINAADVFVLPNRQTYFDLVLLEVISISQRCLISYSGGNKYFSFLKNKGINFFEPDNVSSFIQSYEECDFKEDHSFRLKEAFNKFTLEAFGNNYIKLYKEIIN